MIKDGRDELIKEKPALLRLRIKVYLGTLGIPQSEVWDEPSVIVERMERPLNPDIIVVRDEGIWWWEMKDWKNTVSSTEIKKLFEEIEKVNKANSVKFIRKDGQEEVTDKKVTNVTVICGEGGFSAPAYRFGKEYNFDLKKPDNLGVVVVTFKRIVDDRLLGVEIRVVPKGSEEIFGAPEKIKTP